MWFLRKPPVKVKCFFCKIEVAKDEAYELEYKASDGTGKVVMCPMCAGLMNDMPHALRSALND